MVSNSSLRRLLLREMNGFKQCGENLFSEPDAAADGGDGDTKTNEKRAAEKQAMNLGKVVLALGVVMLFLTTQRTVI